MPSLVGRSCRWPAGSYVAPSPEPMRRAAWPGRLLYEKLPESAYDTAIRASGGIAEREDRLEDALGTCIEVAGHGPAYGEAVSRPGRPAKVGYRAKADHTVRALVANPVLGEYMGECMT